MSAKAEPMPSAAPVPDWLGPLRAEALEIFRAGVRAADPELAVARALRLEDGVLEILLEPGREAGDIRRGPWTKVHLIAFGKAAPAMAKAALRIIPADLLAGEPIVVTNHENATQDVPFPVMAAGHPLPDAGGLAGARAVAASAQGAVAGELVLVLVSGGGSALLPYPPERISLEDKIATTELLLASGADITQINTVRKHLSVLKGGGLARLASPAEVHALILSDVLGDDLSAIASGPTSPDPTSFSDAVSILRSFGVWDRTPDSVRSYLDDGCRGLVDETPKPGDSLFAKAGSTLVGSNAVSLAAAEAAAASSGRPLRVHPEALAGEAREEAEKLALLAGEAMTAQPGGRSAYLCGGETTVTLRGAGQGGRNQEMALAFALAAERHGLPKRWVFLSGGTDGRDGPTDAAGGLVDPWSLERMRAAGEDPGVRLEDNDSHRALESSGDLLRTGATGTNVADLQIVLVE